MHKYVIYFMKNMGLPFLSITLILSLIILQIHSLKYINFVVSNGLDLLGFINLSLLSIPAIISYIMPLSLFVSTCYIYNKFINEKEIVVLQSAGLNSASLMKPALYLSTLISFFIYFNNLFLVPISSEILSSKTSQMQNNFFSGFFQEGVFNHPAKDITIYIDKYDENDGFLGVMIYDDRNDKPVTILSKKAIAQNFSNKAPSFNLINGNRQQINKKEGLDILYFDNFIVDFEVYKKDNGNHSKPMSSYFIWELLNPSKNFTHHEKQIMKIEAIHSLIWPIYSITLSMIACYFLVSGRYDRSGQSIKIAKSSSVASLLVMLTLLTKNTFIKNGNILSFVISIIVIHIFIFVICRKLANK